MRTPGQWEAHSGRYVTRAGNIHGWICEVGPHPIDNADERAANAQLIAAAPDLYQAGAYVVDMTYCGADGEWHFKPGYDPQKVLDALLRADAQAALEG